MNERPCRLLNATHVVKRFLLCPALTVLGLTIVGPVLVSAQTQPQALPPGPELLSQLLARMPQKPVLIAGRFMTATNGGFGKHQLNVEIQFAPSSNRNATTYTIADGFGTPLEQMTVTRAPGAPSRMEYRVGRDLTPAPLPDLGRPIQDTCLSWTDLTLAFLWWGDGVVIGRQEVKGQPCYVLDVHPPDARAWPYGSVRIWIDTRISMLLQAETCNKLGDPVRRLQVKSFKKINDEWMIKDLEVDDVPSGSRTVLRVIEVRDMSAP
jgi:hypothetical protein